MCAPGPAEDCSICLEALRPAAGVVRTECGHRFHADCLGKWEALGNDSCPLCRAPLAPPAPALAPDAFGGPAPWGLDLARGPAASAPAPAPAPASPPAPTSVPPATFGVVVSSIAAVVMWIASDDFIIQLVGPRRARGLVRPPRPSERAATAAAARAAAERAAAARAATERVVAAAIAAGAALAVARG